MSFVLKNIGDMCLYFQIYGRADMSVTDVMRRENLGDPSCSVSASAVVL